MTGTQKNKYVLCRALGGFNDQLNQIQICYDYCLKHGRTLVVDTKLQGIGVVFNDYFSAAEASEVPILSYDETTSKLLNGLRCFPAVLTGALDSYSTVNRTVGKYLQLLLEETNEVPNIRLYGSKEEDVLVHHAFGGGTASFKILKHLQIRSDISDAVIDQLAKLPKDYVALHLRHTDMKVDAERMFEILSRPLIDRDVVLCTDDVFLRETAAGILDPSTRIRFVSELFDTKGRSLHNKENTGYFGTDQAMIDMLSDFFAMVFAKDLIFSRAKVSDNKEVISGFVALANLVRKDLSVAESLLSLASDKQKRALEPRFLNPIPPSDDELKRFTYVYSMANSGKLASKALYRIYLNYPTAVFDCILSILNKKLVIGRLSFSLKSFLRRVSLGAIDL